MEEVLHNIDYNFDFIPLTETWHTDKNLFTAGILPGYQKYEGINGATRNGGCGFCNKETITYFLHDDLSKKHKSQESEFEAFWFKLVGSIYRHPRPKQTKFLKYLKNTLNKIEKENKKQFLLVILILIS